MTTRTSMRPAALLLSCVVVFAAAPACLAAAADAPGACWPGAPGTDPERCPPDDPDYARHWEFRSDIPAAIDRAKMHPAEVAMGSIGMSLDSAWQYTTGRDDVVIAVLDCGIRWSFLDLRRKVALNRGELPLPAGSTSYDANGDGVFDVDDYAADPRVSDRNANGVLDPEDLILAFSDCRDDDGNGYPDDIAGYDFFGAGRCGLDAADPDPRDDTEFGHGTSIASAAGAETNNGIDDVGVCPRCRVLPVRVADSFVVDANAWARGVVFAVRSGATVIASAAGSYDNTPAARLAVDFAYRRGVPVIASAADEYSYHHNYPSAYDHTAYVNAIRYNGIEGYARASTFWGLSPCSNFGARISVSVPVTTCSSGATSRLAGVAGLLESAAREAGLGGLHAEEVYQLLETTADDLDNTSPDWGDLRYPAKPGFDQIYGYGRVNALEAVRAVRAGSIPPRVDLAGPRWFAVVSPRAEPRLAIAGDVRIPRTNRATWRLQYALGVEPREADYHDVASGEITADLEGPLGVLDFERLPLPAGPPPRGRDERDRYTVTVRLRATDDLGNTGEARRSFFVLDDPSWKEHFPVDIGASGEAGPVVADLDGDGRDEIVLASADGYLRILRWEDGGIRTVRAALDRGPALDPSDGILDADGNPPEREPVLRAPAVGDLFGDGRSRIVVASKAGKVYAFSARGERLAFFPVAIPARPDREAAPEREIERGIFSRPVLADLDGKPGLEIIVAGLDGYLYVWRKDGRPLAGFPVEIANPRQSPGHGAKIVSTPVVGDVDGDGVPEIVVGSNGLREDLGAAYAVRADGNRHPGGPFLPGWPVEIPGLRPHLLPTVAAGVQMDPLLIDADGDGDNEVVLYTVTGTTIVLVDHDRAAGGPRVVAEYAMTPGSASEFRGISFLAGSGSPLLADTDGDGEPELYAPLLPLRLLTLRSSPGIPIDVPPALGGWELRGSPAEHGRVPMIPSFPRRTEDLMILTRPVAADVDGDGRREILMGSGGYLLHAFEKDGGEAEGFPKFTGGWIFSAPAIGDLDGDGRPELVVVTREGYLFAWRTEVPSPAPSPARTPNSTIR